MYNNYIIKKNNNRKEKLNETVAYNFIDEVYDEVYLTNKIKPFRK